MKRIAALALILLTAVGFYYLVVSDLNAIVKTVAAIGLLVSCSFSLQKLLGIEGEYGLLLVRTKKGLKLLDRIAKWNPSLWNFITDAGLVVGFGLFSLFLFRKDVPKPAFLVGVLCLILFSQFILPFAGPLAIELIDLPGAEQGLGLASGTIAQATSGQDAGIVSVLLSSLAALMLLAIVCGGVALAGGFALLLKAFTILLALVLFAQSALSGVSDNSLLAGEGPGAAPVLPGVNLAFWEGILALAVLLVVHESAHGILARVAKIPLKSAGMVFLGILPFGAFVDPDEKKLQKTDADAQNRVLVAGSSANMITATVFLLLFLLFYSYVTSAFPSERLGQSYVEIVGVVENGTAHGFIEPGMIVLKWQGVNISTIQDFRDAGNETVEGDSVDVVTDKGTFYLRAGVNGKVGIQAYQKSYAFGSLVRDLAASQPHLPFLFNFLGLAFVLNVLVGIVNLMPIPSFDGYRIVALRIGKGKVCGVSVMDAIVATIVAAFIINLVPWLWT